MARTKTNADIAKYPQADVIETALNEQKEALDAADMANAAFAKCVF